MKTVIAGGTGFLGRALARSLVTAGHDGGTLTRRPPARSLVPAGRDVAPLPRPAPAGPSSNGRGVAWQPDGQAGDWAREIDGATAVVNLAGASIAARRWSAEQKRRIP